MKKKCKPGQKSLGGQLLQAGVSFIPGVGQILAPLVGIADQQIEANKAAEEQQKLLRQPPPIKITNPYGNFKNGGILNDMFKQYDTGSHASGNDLQVDAQGIPDPNGTNTVQNKENSYKIGDKQYVMSDALTNPKTGNKFNQDAMKINKKYPKARFQQDQKNALDLEMKTLSKINDAVRTVEETKQLAYGGPILNKALRDIGEYAKNNLPLQEPNMFANPENQVSMLEDTQPVINNTPTPPTNLLPRLSNTEILSPEQVAEANYQFPEVSSKSNVLGPKVTERSSGVLDPKSANAIALGMKGLALAGSIHDALQPAEKERLLTPNYSKSDAYMRSANIDFTQAKQDAIGVSNIGGNMNRSLSGNAAQYQGREQSRLAQLQDSLSGISEAENNAQSQLNLTKGQYEQNKAVDRTNREYQNQQGNMQNAAAQRFFGRQLASDLSQIGSSFNQYAETTKLNKNNQDIAKFTNSQIMATINAKNPNFKLQDNIVENFISGKTSLDDVLAFVPAESKEEVKKILTEQKLKVQ